MPTDNSVQTVDGVASITPPASSTQSASDDAVKAHPLYKELETRYAAAHKEIDGKKTKKELESEIARLRVLAGETAPAQQVVLPPQIMSGQIDATKLQADIEWNIANKELIKLGGQQYADLLSKGYDRQDALDLATSRLPTADRSVAENLRAQVSASSGASTDRSSVQQPNVGGVSKEYVESMRKRFPNLPEDKLVEIVRRSVAKTNERGA